MIALGACTDEGAHLTFSAPDGPAAAATYELVLASPDLAPAIDAQRVSPDGLQTESVTYYLQRTEVAASGSLDQVDAFTVLVRPSPEITETAFIPFVALHDAAGALVGMGTFRATPGGPPQPILIQHGEVDRYPLAIEPVAQVDATTSLGAGDAMPVDCTRDDQTTWHSGIVWRPHAGGELRLVFPDGSGGDATGRPLDLDCDGHAVSPDDASDDCDDTRSAFHAGAAEACDGEDTNCDAIETLAVPCTPAGGTVCADPSTQMGVALCDDRTGTVGACMSDPGCLCAQNAPGCVRCILQDATNDPPPNQVVPCQPGVGQVSTQNLCDGGSPCTVQVLAVRGGWDARVGTTASGPFGSVAVAVGSSFYLRAKRPEGPGAAIPGAPGHTVGRVDVNVVDVTGASHYMGIDLEMDTSDAVCDASGPYQMACSP